MTRVRDLTDLRFGRLIVLQQAPRRTRMHGTAWHVRCDCGTEKVVNGSNLVSGNVRSCGCLQREIRAALVAHNTKHGESQPRTPEYAAWERMIGRCYRVNDKRFHDYGGRGITVYPLWRTDFPAFLRHVGRRPTAQHSLDRIDVNGNYEPGNVRWATRLQQARNKRNSRPVVDGICPTCGQATERSLDEPIRHRGRLSA